MNILLNNLIQLTYVKEYDKIYSILNDAHTNVKGYLFEDYIKFLYEGNGWLVETTPRSGDLGADLFLKNPQNPNSVSCIIQVKNYRKPLSFDELLLAIKKYECYLKDELSCNQFKIISLNGYIKEAGFRINFIESIVSLDSWPEIRDLITHHSIKHTKPFLYLFPHNERAFKNIILQWKTTRYTCIVHATGTGKSYILGKILWKYYNSNIIVIAPSIYILDQIKKSTSIYESNTITFITYSYLLRNTKKILGRRFDFIILDEFHRAGASKWGKTIDKLLKSNNEAKILGTSATPIRYLDNNRDMRDELFYGNISSELTLPAAIIKGILPIPKYITAVYTLRDEIEKIKERLNIQDFKLHCKERILNVIEQLQINWEHSKGIDSILKKYLSKDQNKFIIFCENIQHLQIMDSEVKKWFVKSGIHKRTLTYTVTSKNTVKENRSAIKKFELAENKSSFHLLFSVDMLNEGIHIPDIDGVLFLRTTFSPIIFYQQLGRCLHVGNNSPIVFDLVNNFDCVQVIDFARMFESTLEEENKNRKDLGLKENCPLFEVHDETRDIQNKIKELQNKYSSWEDNFGLLKKYYLENNSYPTSKYLISIESDIEKWSYRQRKLFLDNRLDSYKIDKLKSVDFPFTAENRKWRKVLDNYRVLIIKENYPYNSPTRNSFEKLQFNLFHNFHLDEYKKKMLDKYKINKPKVFKSQNTYTSPTIQKEIYSNEKNTPNYYTNSRHSSWWKRK